MIPSSPSAGSQALSWIHDARRRGCTPARVKRDVESATVQCPRLFLVAVYSFAWLVLPFVIATHARARLCFNSIDQTQRWLQCTAGPLHGRRVVTRLRLRTLMRQHHAMPAVLLRTRSRRITTGKTPSSQTRLGAGDLLSVLRSSSSRVTHGENFHLNMIIAEQAS